MQAINQQNHVYIYTHTQARGKETNNRDLNNKRCIKCEGSKFLSREDGAKKKCEITTLTECIMETQLESKT